MKPQRFKCSHCGAEWLGAASGCPNGCDVVAKSEGEYTKKTFQGDNDLKKAR